MAKQKTTWVFLIVNLLFGLFSIAYTEAQPARESEAQPKPVVKPVVKPAASPGGDPKNPIPPSRGSKDPKDVARIRREKKEERKRKKKKQNNNFTSYDGGLEYSFSGADCDVFAYRQGSSSPIHLESIATVSVSVYTAKAPVRRLGHALAVGYTGSIVSVAGSIICYLQNGHPLKELMEGDIASKHLDKAELLLSYGGEGASFISGMIYPFELMLMYKNEIGNTLGMRVSNIEIISEGIVTSINDMATEVVFQFVATHIEQLAPPPRPPPPRPPPPPAKEQSTIKNITLGYLLVLGGSISINGNHYDFYGNIFSKFISDDIVITEVSIGNGSTLNPETVNADKANLYNSIKNELNSENSLIKTFGEFNTVNKINLTTANFDNIAKSNGIIDELITVFSENNPAVDKSKIESLLKDTKIIVTPNNAPPLNKPIASQEEDLDKGILYENSTVDFSYADPNSYISHDVVVTLTSLKLSINIEES